MGVDVMLHETTPLAIAGSRQAISSKNCPINQLVFGDIIYHPNKAQTSETSQGDFRCFGPN